MSNTIDYLNDKGEVVFYVDPDKGIVGEYKNSDSIVLRNNLRPYIQCLKGNIIQLDNEIAYLKQQLIRLKNK